MCEMVPRRGFEPPTYRLGICRSVQLSYRGMFKDFYGVQNDDSILILNPK